MAADLIAIVAAMVLAACIWEVLTARPESIAPIVVVGAISLPVWILVFARYRLYKSAAISSRVAEASRIIHAVAAAAAGTALIGLALKANVSRGWLVLTFVMAALLVTCERAVVRQMFARVRIRGRLVRPIVVVGTTAEAIATVQMLNDNPYLGYRVIGLLTGTEPLTAFPTGGVQVLGHSEDALRILRDNDATGAIITTSAVEVATANRLARDLTDAGFHVELTSGLVDISADRLLTHALGRRAVLHVEPVMRVGWRGVAKRTFDVVLAGGLLILTSPVLLVSAIVIKLDSRGPVLFSQVRVGKDGALFRVLKLRTMQTDAEQKLEQLRALNEMDGPLFKIRDDPRVTKPGAFLRRWSIDEVPQLWNVVRGEMSIVGPRPALPSEVDGWTEELRGRLRVRPGITGMWQVNGRSNASFEDYIRHDLYYVDNWSLLTDLAVVAKTIPTVLSHRDAY